jgi:2'-5' RNA ligase
MRLFAAIVPPEHVRAEVADVVRTIAPETPELAMVRADKMRIFVTSFGNVSLADGVVLNQALREAAAGWRRAEVRFHGSAALEFEGDRSVWAKLDGDVESALAIGRGVPVVIQPLGFLVDRRRFRPWLSVGSITDATTLPYLERLTGALEEHKGSTWTLDTLTVFKSMPADQGGDVVHTEIPLGAG